jgi:hypothetical protein
VKLAYSGLHLHEEVVFGFPLPLWERDRVRGKATATNLLIQAKSAVNREKPATYLASDLLAEIDKMHAEVVAYLRRHAR